MILCIYLPTCPLNKVGYSNKLFYSVLCRVSLEPTGTSQRQRSRHLQASGFPSNGNAERPWHEDEGGDGIRNRYDVAKHLDYGKASARVSAVVSPTSAGRWRITR